MVNSVPFKLFGDSQFESDQRLLRQFGIVLMCKVKHQLLKQNSPNIDWTNLKTDGVASSILEFEEKK